MKKTVIIGIVAITLGMVISLGPQFMFKVCSPMAMSTDLLADDGACGCSGDTINFPVCHWTARAEIGIGFLIVALGICLMFFFRFKNTTRIDYWDIPDKYNCSFNSTCSYRWL